MNDVFTLERQKNPLAVVRLGATDGIPPWANPEDGDFISITRTADELSIVCDAHRVPADARAERDWTALKIAGPLAFIQVGIIASLSEVLARAEIPIFVISTYDTDYLLVREADANTATDALAEAGHRVR